MLRAMTQNEVRFFAYTQSYHLKTVETGQLVAMLGLKPDEERKLLSRLSLDGLITRVRRGLYLVPPKLPPGGLWGPSEALAMATLMEDCGGQYQLCGLNAFNRYHWSGQMPNWYCLYNNRLSGKRQVGNRWMKLIKVADSRLGGVDPVTLYDGQPLRYPSKARALMDAVYDWSKFGTLPKAYKWIRRELAADASLAEDLVDATLRYGNQGTIRRIGNLLEQEGAPAKLMGRLEKRLSPAASLIPWDPTRPRRGKANRRWGLVLNDQ